MTLRLRNTLTRMTEPVEAADGRRFRMYSCGPTVYRYAHVGNLRTFLLADLVRRVVLYHGIPVLHVQNITDVGHLRDEHQLDRDDQRDQEGDGSTRMRNSSGRRMGDRRLGPAGRDQLRDRIHQAPVSASPRAPDPRGSINRSTATGSRRRADRT